jgi:hypothetical protein
MISARELARYDAFWRFWCTLFHWRGYWYPEYPNRRVDGRVDDRWRWICEVRSCRTRLPATCPHHGYAAYAGKGCVFCQSHEGTPPSGGP